MSTAAEIIRAALAIRAALESAGINSRRVDELFERARASGKPIADEQIEDLARDAQSAIDRIGP